MSESGIPGEVIGVVEEQQQTETGPRRMILNMGPQHPSTHGVLRLLLELDGETITKCEPELGYLHTGSRRNSKSKTISRPSP